MKAPSSKMIIDFPKEDEKKKPRTFSIILDKRTLGSITSGEKKEFNIAAGDHSLFITGENFNSISHRFRAEADKELYLEIRFEPLEPYPKSFSLIMNNKVPLDTMDPSLKMA